MHGRLGRAARARPVLGALLGYALVVLVLLGPAIRPGRTLVPADTLTHYSPYREQAGGFRAHNGAVSDAATQFLPWLRFLDTQLHRGHVPGWNPGILAGVPVTPNAYVSPYYPPFWAGRFLDAFDTYDLFVALHLVLGALGVFVLARILGARPFAAWVAGLYAPASGAWLHWSLHLDHVAAMAWLPWALAATHRAVEAPGPRRVAALGVVLGLWWLGANAQFGSLGVVVVAAYALGLVVWRRAGRGALATLAAGALLGALLAAPVVLPTASAAGGILRRREPAASMTATHLPLRHGIRLLVPDATGNPADGFVYAADQEQAMDSPYVGLTALLLAAAALASPGVRRNRGALLLAALAAGVVVLAFTGPPHVVLRAVLPGYDRFRGSARWVGVLAPLVLPVAALGLDAILAGERAARRALTVAAAAAAALVGLWLARELAVATAPHGYLARRALLAAGLAAAAAGAAALVGSPGRRRRLAAGGLLAACAALEVAVAVPRWYPRVVEHDAYPPVAALTAAAARGGRIVRVGGPRDLPDVVPPDVPLAYGVADTSGLTPLFPRDYDRYLRLIDDYGDTARQLNVAPPLAAESLLGSPLLAALDARTALLPGAATRPLASPGPALLVARAEPVDDRAAWRAVASPAWDPAASAAVVGLPRAVAGGAGAVRRVDDGRDPDRERWTVDAPEGGFLRVSGRDDGGWSARLDGRRVTVYRADAIFRGVVVPPGRHVVTFAYRNAAEHTGRAVAIGGLLALVLLVAGHALSWPARLVSRRSLLPGVPSDTLRSL